MSCLDGRKKFFSWSADSHVVFIIVVLTFAENYCAHNITEINIEHNENKQFYSKNSISKFTFFYGASEPNKD